MSSQYPDYKKEGTFVVTRTVDEENSYSARKKEVEDRFGKILEEMITQDQAEAFGKVFFRVKRPDWWISGSPNSGR